MPRVLLALFLLLWPLQAMSQSLPEPLSDTVSDFADLLPPEAEARVTEALLQGRKETGVHVVLVTLESLAAYGGAGQRIEDYAKTLFNTWGVGDSTRNDGILILIARDDRSMRIALGSGYEVIWDNAAQRVIDRYFLPAFRADDYAAGIEAGVPATFDLIAVPFVAGNPPTPEPEPQTDWLVYAPVVMFGAVFATAIGLILRAALSDVLVGFKPCPQCSKRHLSRHRDVVQAATQLASGQGLLHTRCSACGYHDSTPYTIARVSDSDSSSGGGFGGGSSSGGGATGKW